MPSPRTNPQSRVASRSIGSASWRFVGRSVKSAVAPFEVCCSSSLPGWCASTSLAGDPRSAQSLQYNEGDDRSHGRDERVPVGAYYEGMEFTYQLVKAVTQ